ncbi:MAG: hypothetical protein ACQEP8_06300, partial [Chlamydiota bacterium]
TAVQWFWIFFIGMGVFLVSYPCWNLGVKKGNFTLLALLSYFTPLISVLFLITFGEAEPSLSLLLACFFIILSSTFRVVLGKLFKPLRLLQKYKNKTACY